MTRIAKSYLPIFAFTGRRIGSGQSRYSRVVLATGLLLGAALIGPDAANAERVSGGPPTCSKVETIKNGQKVMCDRCSEQFCDLVDGRMENCRIEKTTSCEVDAPMRTIKPRIPKGEINNQPVKKNLQAN
jgi:hypothetical protein